MEIKSIDLFGGINSIRYAICVTTEFNIDESKPKIAYAKDKTLRIL